MKKTEINIKPFLDEDGYIVSLPAKHSVRVAVLAYLSEKFEVGRQYSEKEINQICDCWHTFNDYFVLRRCLIDEGFLMRKNDGSSYWRPEKEVIPDSDEEAN